MYNINLPHNKDLLEKCKALKEYSELVSLIREYQKSEDIEIAVDKAVNQMIHNNGVLSQLLLAHRAEVYDMCITEYNEKIHEDNVRAEGIEVGKTEGLIALINTLRPIFNDDFDMVCKHIRQNEAYSKFTDEMIKKYWTD